MCTHSAAGHMDPDKLGKAGSRYHEANLFVELDKQVFDAGGAKTGPVSVRGMSPSRKSKICDELRVVVRRDDYKKLDRLELQSPSVRKLVRKRPSRIVVVSLIPQRSSRPNPFLDRQQSRVERVGVGTRHDPFQ